MKFREKLGETERRHYRLPTEAEWEYACRAGSQTLYGGGSNLDEVGWYSGNSNGQTHPVAQKKPNAWGIFDMSGNVYRWWSEGYGPYGGDAVDPKGVSDTTVHVLRGGSYNLGPPDCRTRIAIGSEPTTGATTSGSASCWTLPINQGRKTGQVRFHFIARP